MKVPQVVRLDLVQCEDHCNVRFSGRRAGLRLIEHILSTPRTRERLGPGSVNSTKRVISPNGLNLEWRSAPRIAAPERRADHQHGDVRDREQGEPREYYRDRGYPPRRTGRRSGARPPRHTDVAGPRASRRPGTGIRRQGRSSSPGHQGRPDVAGREAGERVVRTKSPASAASFFRDDSSVYIWWPDG